jgi:hypothetical protein
MGWVVLVLLRLTILMNSFSTTVDGCAAELQQFVSAVN